MIVVDMGYHKLVMSKERAMQLVDVLENSEVYEDKYWNDAERKARGITDSYTYHVYPNDKSFAMKIITDEHYQLARLAGKPTKD